MNTKNGREYKVTPRQVRVLKKAIKRGVTTLKGLQRELRVKKIPVSRKAISDWRIKTRVGKRSAFAEDVRGYMKASGETDYSIARKKTLMYPKWLDKRVGRLSIEEQKMYKEWCKLDREFRHSEFSKARGKPKGLSEKLLRDYEDYFETEK